MGHKNSNTTDHHIQLVAFNSEEFYSAVSHTVEEAKHLIEAGLNTFVG